MLANNAGQYALARQFKRKRRTIKRQRTIVGRLQREIVRKMNVLSAAVQDAINVSLNKVRRLITQTRSRNIQGKQPKLYRWYAAEVPFISKGKSRNPFEFGVKVGLAITLRST